MKNVLLGAMISFSALSQSVGNGGQLQEIDCAIEKQRFTGEYNQAIRIQEYYEESAKKREQYIVDLAEQVKNTVQENKTVRDELLAYSSEYQALSLELKKAGKGELNSRDDAKLRQMSDFDSYEAFIENSVLSSYSGLSFDGIKKGALVIELSPIKIPGIAISETTKLLVRADSQGKLLVEVDDSAFLKELFKKEDLRLISVDEYVKRELSEVCKEGEELKRKDNQSRGNKKARSGLNPTDLGIQYDSVIKR